MLSFECDYTRGAHPAVLEHLLKTNMEQTSGYGFDPYCERAKEKIRLACGAPAADIFFLVGGTQANLTVISSLLRPYEAVVSADTGHINGNEAGAIEGSGHKILTIPGKAGKLLPEDLRPFLACYFASDILKHKAIPAMVYLSFPTELGTIYSRAELTAISEICREYGLLLFIDGARLGYGLTCDACDITLQELAELSDVFYIGGTKVGALCGEALVFPKGNASEYFMTMIKQRGALVAKGRLLGVQFDALFTDDLYFKIARNANVRAGQIRQLMAEHNVPLYADSPTNQQFFVFENDKLAMLSQICKPGYWGPKDDTHSVVRFVTDWSTTQEDVDLLAAALDQIMAG